MEILNKNQLFINNYSYPYTIPNNDETNKQTSKKNPYSIKLIDDTMRNKETVLGQLTDEVLSTLFAVKMQLCNQKFELKINDVRFVSHPAVLQTAKSSYILINIVFALQAQCSYSIGISLIYSTMFNET